jgi:hypothetical protein
MPAVINGHETYRLTRHPGRALSGAFTRLRESDELSDEDWVTTVADAYANLYSHVPFMRDHFRRVGLLSDGRVDGAWAARQYQYSVGIDVTQHAGASQELAAYV